MISDFIEYYNSQFGKEVLNQESSFIRDNLKNCTNILDVGCGIGIFEEKLNQLPITGLDLDRLSIEEARRRSKQRFVHGDATRMEFKTQTFDGIFAVTTLEFIPEIKLVLDEIYRVLKTHGKIVFLLLNTRSRYFQQQSKRQDSYFHKICHDHTTIREYIEDQFLIKQGYMLGINGLEVFETSNPKWAAIHTIIGEKKE